MELIIYYEELKEDKRRGLIKFFLSISDKFSITTDYKGKLTKVQFEKIQKELREYFTKEEMQFEQKYKENLNYRKNLEKALKLKNEKDCLKYLDMLKRENKSTLESISYKECTNEQIYEPFFKRGFLRNNISRISGTSIGGIYNILYYGIEEFNHVIGDGCYNYLWIEKEQFWDPAFYQKDQLVGQVQTDRKEMYCQFTKDQFNCFCNLGIAYEEAQ